MGLRAALKLVSSVNEPTSVARAQQVGWQSPFPSDGTQLQSVVWPDLLDLPELMPMTRAEAMSVPAIAKARHVLCPKIAGYPLRALRFSGEYDDEGMPVDEPVRPQPTWLSRTDDGVSPWHRMSWTVDDLMFTGWSLWAANRGSEGQLLTAARIGRPRWSFDSDWAILVDSKPVPEGSVILIPGPHEGICTFGRIGIRHAAELMKAASNAGKTPSPTMEIHNTGEDLDDDEIDEQIDMWAKARRGENSGVGYTNRWTELKEHKSIDAALLVEGRNAAAVECARIVGIAAAMIDATVPKASLNYETTEGRGLEHTEYGVEPYAESIAARLSLDDVVPRGQRVRFDISSDVGEVEPTGPAQED